MGGVKEGGGAFRQLRQPAKDKDKGVLKGGQFSKRSEKKQGEKDQEKDAGTDKDKDKKKPVTMMLQSEFCGAMVAPSEAEEHMATCEVYLQMQGLASQEAAAAAATAAPALAATESAAGETGLTEVKQEPTDSEAAVSQPPAESPLGGSVDLRDDDNL